MRAAAKTAWPWAALPVAGVLAVDPSGLAPFGPIKWALVPALVLAGVATTGLRARRDWLGAFVAWSAVAALFGLDGLYAWTGTPERHFGVLTWVLVLVCWWTGRSLDGRARRLVLAASAATVGALGLWVLAEELGWEPLRLTGVGDEPVGTLGSSAFLGAAAVLLTPVALGWVWQSRGRTRIAAVAATSLGMIAMTTSAARAAWVGIAVASVVAALIGRDRRTTTFVATGCAVVVLVLAMATGAIDRVTAVATDREGGARGRLDEWRIALRIVAAHPVVGTGPEGYRIAFEREVDDRYEQDHGRSPVPDRAHSAPLDVAATTGLVGLALYLAAIAGAVRAALRALRSGPPMLGGAAVGVLAYFTQSLFLFPIAELEPVAWLLAGLCATSSIATPHRPRRVAAIGAGALALVAFVAGGLDVAADRRAQHALGLIADDTPADATSAHLRPDQVRLHLVDARVHASNGSIRGLTLALADVDEALDISPYDPVARNEKGRLLLERARLGVGQPAALRYLTQRSHDDPRNAETLLRLGLIRELTGDDDGAIRAWRSAEQLAPRSAAASSNLAVAYARTGRTKDAEAAARRALRRDPSNEAARAVLEQLAADGT